MLVPWKPTATWNSLVAGVTADGLEASRQKDGFTFGKISASTSAIPFEVTDTVQAWVNGEANHGWVFINTGGNGWDFYTSEFDDVKQRPKLVVEFTPPRSECDGSTSATTTPKTQEFPMSRSATRHLARRPVALRPPDAPRLPSASAGSAGSG